MSPEEKQKRIAKLSELEFHVTQENGTEKPFDNIFDQHKDEGIYVDTVSGEPLFSSKDKFDAGCGWPSFSRPIQQSALVEEVDRSGGRRRIEVRSNEADSHLGHVFNDGPEAQGGLRYCINSAALRFIPVAELSAAGYGDYTALFKDTDVD